MKYHETGIEGCFLSAGYLIVSVLFIAFGFEPFVKWCGEVYAKLAAKE